MTTPDRFTILIADHNGPVRTFLADNLVADGYDVVLAETAADTLRSLESEFPDVTLLASALRDANGLDVLRHVRSCDGVASRLDADTPILLMGVGDGELERIRGFERGADDVLAEGLGYRETRCRIDALLRRRERRGRAAGRLRVADLDVDTTSRTVSLGGAVLDLSAKEFALLRVLATEPTRVFTKAELLRSVWGHRTVGTTRTLDSHACRLRRKLGADGARFVVNVWGVGYRLVDAPHVEAQSLRLLAAA